MTGAKPFLIAVLIIIFIIIVLALMPIFLGRREPQPSGQGQGTLFKSEDGGGSWKVLDKFQGGEVSTLDFDAKDSKTLLVGTRLRGLWRGDTDGEDWQQFPGGVGESSQIFDLLDAPNKDEFVAMVLFTNRGRIIRYKDGARVELLFTPLERFAFFRGYLARRGIIRVIGSDGGFYESLNQGSSWRVVSRFREGLLLMASNPSNSDEVWVIDSRGSLFHSLDGGESWRNLTQGLSKFQGAAQPEFIFLEPQSRILYHGSEYGFLRSFDGGNSWEVVGLPGAPQFLPISALAVAPDNPRKLIVGAQGQLYISQDGGDSWKGILISQAGAISYILINPGNTDEIFIGLRSGRSFR